MGKQLSSSCASFMVMLYWIESRVIVMDRLFRSVRVPLLFCIGLKVFHRILTFKLLLTKPGGFEQKGEIGVSSDRLAIIVL